MNLSSTPTQFRSGCVVLWRGWSASGIRQAADNVVRPPGGQAPPRGSRAERDGNRGDIDRRDPGSLTSANNNAENGGIVYLTA